MTQKQLDELLSKAAISFEDEEEAQEYHRHDVVMEALRLAYNKGVTDSAESAEVIYYPGTRNHEERHVVNEDSILKNLIP